MHILLYKNECIFNIFILKRYLFKDIIAIINEYYALVNNGIISCGYDHTIIYENNKLLGFGSNYNEKIVGYQTFEKKI